MNPGTRHGVVPGPAGPLVTAIEDPPAPAGQARAARGLALLCHPHPLHGGTLDNKVVQTLARALLALGWRCVRFNFRGAGGSQGQWDEGHGEIDDALAVLSAARRPGEPLLLGGFSFGAYVASQVARRLAQDPSRAAQRLVLVGTAASRFEVAPVPADTLVVHGELDDVVPLSAVLDWARPQALPITVVLGAGHFFHGQLPLLKNIVLQALAPRTEPNG